MNTAQVAEVLGLPVKTVQKMARDGRDLLSAPADAEDQ